MGGSPFGALGNTELRNNFEDLRWANRPRDMSGFVQVPTIYYDKKLFTSASTTKLTFFSGSQISDFNCNLNQGRVPQEKPFYMVGFGFRVTDVSIAGALTATMKTNGPTTQAALDALTVTAAVLEAGLVKVKYGDRVIFDCLCADLFAVGAGVNLEGVGVNTTFQTAKANSGLPIPGAFARFLAPFACMPDRVLEVTIDWTAALTLAANTHINAYLFGQSLVALPN